MYFFLSEFLFKFTFFVEKCVLKVHMKLCVNSALIILP